MIRVLIPVLAFAACTVPNPIYEARVMQLAAANDEVAPGHASCLLAIDRPDVALDPAADMTAEEIERFVACAAERASR
ncbi:MAG: hypothetical protein AAF264_14550 [Pseudomonadota bacterium]